MLFAKSCNLEKPDFGFLRFLNCKRLGFYSFGFLNLISSYVKRCNLGKPKVGFLNWKKNGFCCAFSFSLFGELEKCSWRSVFKFLCWACLSLSF